MAKGSDFSPVILHKVIHFNGGLFENPSALPLKPEHIQLLLEAARKDWQKVEPAIFGTLLERALDPRERHKLGAHYTPRSYVDRLIEPSLMEPLRQEWDQAKGAAALYHDKGKDDKARAEIETFHRQLCQTRVLDPACGSGNFLYVALARIKELEAEVLDLYEDLGGIRSFELDEFKVRPSQFLGLELNPRAAAIAQIVLWIGYFQWHHKTTGTADTNDRPLLEGDDQIKCQDAVLAYDEKIPLLDDEGIPVTIWNGHTTKPHPVTGKEVPDTSNTAQKAIFTYVNPRRTEWPQADYIVGNPPFLGTSRMREGLGDGYTEALRKAFKKHKPDSWDFVMFWWHQAAEIVQAKKAKQFGFITTNSIHQTFNRRCLESFLNNDKKPLSLTFAIPDHPWIDSADGAAVRIAMTVATYGKLRGKLFTVTAEEEIEEGEHLIESQLETGFLVPNISLGANTSSAIPLVANLGLSSQGMKLHGKGFIVDISEAERIGLGTIDHIERHIRPFVGPKDIVQSSRARLALDFDGLSSQEVRDNFPAAYDKLLRDVKPERDSNREEYRRLNWWLFGRRNTKIREFTKDLEYYLATPRTAKHRIFTQLRANVISESEIVVIGLFSQDILGILSSQIHEAWALNTCGWMGAGNDPRYNNTRCFETFPFPDLPEGDLKTRIRDLGERLDAHRKTQQAQHPDLTLTGIYNVLEKLRKEEELTDKDKVIHDQGLVTLLKQLHDDLDAAVYEAYGWSDLWQWQQDLLTGTCYDPEKKTAVRLEIAPGTTIVEATQPWREKYEQILLQRLVDLNHERAAEEANGKIRYLRPEFQDPDYGKKIAQKQQAKLDLPTKAKATSAPTTEKLPWPKTLTEQIATLKVLLQTLPPDPEVLSPALKNKNTAKRRTDIQDLLDALTSLGQL